MGIRTKIKDVVGVVYVQIEGYFTERFINLCKINNVKIWEIKQIVPGVTRFKMHISEFKKLRPISKKTKCRVLVKRKKGIYFKLLKYRKRKIAVALIILLILVIGVLSNRIWKIDIVGNESVSSEFIEEVLKESGLYVGKSKSKFKAREITDKFRANVNGVSWVGIELKGTTAEVKIIEKEVLNEKYAQDDSVMGDIIAEKSGLLTKIIAENGTAKFKTGSYIEENSVIIEGVINSKVIEPKKVHAKGIVYINKDYVYEKEYLFKNINKEYLNNIRYTVGFSINDKENMLNYLNKNKKYDITRNENSINLFGKKISFDLYKVKEFKEVEIVYSKEDLIEMAKKEFEEYLNNELLKNLVDPNVVKKDIKENYTENGLLFRVDFVVNEKIGRFVSNENSGFHIDNIMN